MKIEMVTQRNFDAAAAVYGISWRESHKNVCTPEYLERRDYGAYLSARTEGLYLISDEKPVGVFRLYEGTLSDLYIHPDHFGKGYGTACVNFALYECQDLRLTVLSTNSRAIGFYEKIGFRFTGKDVPLRGDLWEREMRYEIR